MKFMKKKEQKVKNNHKSYERWQIFAKVMAAVLAVLMVAGTGVSLIYALIA